MTTTDGLRHILNTDPLADAERLTGHSYKDDPGTMSLGFALALSHNASKADALRAAGDTHFNQTWAEATETYARLGFTQVASWPFAGDDKPEVLTAWWHPDGILLTAESYNTHSLNTSKAYYNVRWFDMDDRRNWSRQSSGRTSDGVHIGDRDAREGLAVGLDGLREVGEFLPTWTERPWLWLLTYMDTRGEFNHDEINARRIADLPQHVQDAIKGES